MNGEGGAPVSGGMEDGVRLACPSCGEAAGGVRLRSVFTFPCRGCRTVTMNVAALRAFLDERLAKSLWRALLENGERTADHACPTCARPFQEVRGVCEEGSVTAMGCGTCRLVAFDASALSAVARSPDPPPTARAHVRVRPVPQGERPPGVFHPNFRTTETDLGDEIVAALVLLPLELLGLL